MYLIFEIDFLWSEGSGILMPAIFKTRGSLSLFHFADMRILYNKKLDSVCIHPVNFEACYKTVPTAAIIPSSPRNSATPGASSVASACVIWSGRSGERRKRPGAGRKCHRNRAGGLFPLRKSKHKIRLSIGQRVGSLAGNGHLAGSLPAKFNLRLCVRNW